MATSHKMFRRTLIFLALLLLAVQAYPQEPISVPEPEQAVFPNLNIYLPEGETDIRFQRLIKNVLFESQINYNFVEGDIAAYLRYRYYARNFTYKLGVFDTVEFDAVDRLSQDFSRTRGALLLFEIPRDFHTRYFLLAQVDRLTFSRQGFEFDHNQTNTYVKLAYQYGTPNDERSNSIVGETRARVRSLFTPLQEIGPHGTGLSLAVTTGLNFAGDYNYVKAELEVLKAFNVRQKRRFIARLHIGSFPYKEQLPERVEEPQDFQYSIPHYELFKLGGRDELKGADGSLRGTQQLHLTGEYYFPVFTDKDFRFLKLTWQNLWGIGYAGFGNIGYTTKIYSQLDEYSLDLGVGVQAAVSLRKHQFFLMILFARAFDNEHGGKFYVSVKSLH